MTKMGGRLGNCGVYHSESSKDVFVIFAMFFNEKWRWRKKEQISRKRWLLASCLFLWKNTVLAHLLASVLSFTFAQFEPLSYFFLPSSSYSSVCVCVCNMSHSDIIHEALKNNHDIYFFLISFKQLRNFFLLFTSLIRLDKNV